MVTPGGFRMSVAMTNCGEYGWVSSEAGYRYAELDPATGQRWPALPPAFEVLARRAAAAAGFAQFAPDACLVNRYEPAARLTLHQDKDEHDFTQPIVSVSLGAPATFLFGGLKRRDRPLRLLLEHGDVCMAPSTVESGYGSHGPGTTAVATTMEGWPLRESSSRPPRARSLVGRGEDEVLIGLACGVFDFGWAHHRGVKALRGADEELERVVSQERVPNLLLGRRQIAVDECCGDLTLVETGHLLTHQRFQWRDDESAPSAQQNRHLETQRFSRSRGAHEQE
jgi:alkylated DNA repair protein (DNA oxidative demethylase)